ncbi:hypothetical protein [Desulfotignum balticum]|jgi:hypothetical protein|uniref:hypothetical protein n=1 Tax=Desulfotignum balticum TaxID=115781 RepID=UPI000409DE26|nr:hypothetical protein [Desulfotignum balticum]
MTDHDKKKENNGVDLDVCTQAPEFAEHARPNESPQDACDDGRAGTGKNKQESDSSK